MNLPTITANSLIDFRFQSLYNFLIKQMSKNVDISDNINYDGNRNTRSHCDKRGIKIMTDHEKELVNMIRENDNPEQALMTVAVIILNYLTQHESFEAQVPAYLQVQV